MECRTFWSGINPSNCLRSRFLQLTYVEIINDDTNVTLLPRLFTLWFHRRPGSRDGLDFCWQSWEDLGISNGRGTFLTFSVANPSGNIWISIAIYANPIPLHYIPYQVGYRGIFGPNLIMLMAAGPCFQLTGGICKFYTGIFDYRRTQYCIRYIGLVKFSK